MEQYEDIGSIIENYKKFKKSKNKTSFSFREVWEKTPKKQTVEEDVPVTESIEPVKPAQREAFVFRKENKHVVQSQAVFSPTVVSVTTVLDRFNKALNDQQTNTEDEE